ncbi:hypothetical protein, partial [Burkholderia sp.]|uniref:hypothetical protein n=1 Tax=Burkholderia sp. TaxID=36773 RepID=UPI00258A5DAD
RGPETSGIPVACIVEGQFCRGVTGLQPRDRASRHPARFEIRSSLTRFICRFRDGFFSAAPFNA